MIPSTYPTLIGPAVLQFRSVLDMTSSEFIHTVGVALRVAASDLPLVPNVRSLEGKPHRAVNRNQQGDIRVEKCQRMPMESPGRTPPGRIPTWDLTSLKNATGKTICGHFALRNNCRMNPCKYEHCALPNNLSREVNNWI